MRLVTIYIVFILCFPVKETFAQDEEFRKIENNAFKKGESLKYLVHYGWIDVGYSIMSVQDDSITKSGRSCYYVKGEGYSTGIWDWFFKVRDFYESYIDMTALFPWESHRKVLEDDYSTSDYMIWDHHNKNVKTYRTSSDSLFSDLVIPKNSQEVLSAFYYCRTLDLTKYEVGSQIPIPNFILDGVLYPFNLEVIGRDTIKTSLGKFSCYVLRPLVQEGRIFSGQEDMTLWISDDGLNIPIRVKTDILVGAIKMDLVDYDNLVKPLRRIN